MRKRSFLLVACICVFLCCDGQDLIKPLYSITIIKTVNVNSKISRRIIEIDSVGNVKSNGKLTEHKFDVELLSQQISSYTKKEKIDIYPGNNEIRLREIPKPAVDQQLVIVSIKFLDDYQKERELANKTYYSWGKLLELNDSKYPLFQYLNKDQVALLKRLLDVN